MIMKSRCENLLMAAIHVSGRHNRFQDTAPFVAEIIESAECCRNLDRRDLAAELLDSVSKLSAAQADVFRIRIAEERLLIAQGVKDDPSSANTGELPPIAIRGWNFAKALAKWTAAGFPRRDQAEIDQRLAICQACPNLKNDHCTLCGCACSEKNQLINKLALATEKCPIGKWK